MNESYYTTLDGDLNRRLSVGDIREVMQYRGTEPEDLETPYMEWLVESLYARKGVVLVTVYDEEKRHLGVTFRGEKHVEGGTLDFMAEQGFKASQAGTQDYPYENDEWYRNAYAEFRPLPNGADQVVRTHFMENHIR